MSLPSFDFVFDTSILLSLAPSLSFIFINLLFPSSEINLLSNVSSSFSSFILIEEINNSFEMSCSFSIIKKIFLMK